VRVIFRKTKESILPWFKIRKIYRTTSLKRNNNPTFPDFDVPGVFSMKSIRIASSTLSAAVLGFLALGLASTSAAGSTPKTDTFTVTANVVDACTITAGGTLAFGSYTGTALPGATSITVTCTNGGTYQIGLNGGTTTGGIDTQRLLAGPNGATLKYNLFTDTTYTTVWGNTSINHWLVGTGTGTTQTITVNGRVDAGQGLTVGNYSDSITATVNY
jgi:spore coat protein U-like protein